MCVGVVMCALGSVQLWHCLQQAAPNHVLCMLPWLMHGVGRCEAVAFGLCIVTGVGGWFACLGGGGFWLCRQSLTEGPQAAWQAAVSEQKASWTVCTCLCGSVLHVGGPVGAASRHHQRDGPLQVG